MDCHGCGQPVGQQAGLSDSLGDAWAVEREIPAAEPNQSRGTAKASLLSFARMLDLTSTSGEPTVGGLRPLGSHLGSGSSADFTLYA